MGHTKPSELKDLSATLAEISQLENLKQKGAGVFYWKSIPFLHFHVKDGSRWADVKKREGGWMKIEIAFEASAAKRAGFLKTVKAAHARIAAPKK